VARVGKAPEQARAGAFESVRNYNVKYAQGPIQGSKIRKNQSSAVLCSYFFPDAFGAAPAPVFAP